MDKPNPYLTEWDPSAYLRQYLSTPQVSEDEQANFEFAVAAFRRSGRRFGVAVEVGCGPTLHHAFALVPHVEELHLTDYLPENLQEVRRYLSAEPDAHNWDAYISGVLTAEGEAAPRCLRERERLLRQRVTTLKAVDIRMLPPLADHGKYDLVASYYCAECVATTQEEWRRYLANICVLIAPGGVLLLGALRRCRAYRVFDRAFPSAYVDELDFAAALPALGFATSATTIRAVPVMEWSSQGFESICCVWAEKDRTS